MTFGLVKQCVGELAGLAEKLLEKIPDKEEWRGVRSFLQNTIRLLRRGDVMAGVVAFQRVLPYVERALNHVDRYVKVSDTYQLTETISEHFLVDDESRENIEKFLAQTKIRMLAVQATIEEFGQQLDELLEAVIQNQKEVTFITAIQLAFQMNRISAHIQACEDRLQRARQMLDDLDTHVAGKSFLASLLSYACFFGSVVFTSSGNLPAGAACLATATASRKSAQGLVDYRQRLAHIDRDHAELQSQLNDWHFRFRAEQRNFLLLAGIKYAILLLLVLGACFLLLGKAANFLFFATFFMFIAIKAEQTNNMRYFAVLGVALVAMAMEYYKHHGLIAFNTGATIFMTIQFLGFLEII